MIDEIVYDLQLWKMWYLMSTLEKWTMSTDQLQVN